MKQKIPERVVQQAIREWLEYQGWQVWKLRIPLYSKGHGLPDLLAIKNSTALWLEVKGQGSSYKATNEQTQFLGQIKAIKHVKTGVARSIDDVEKILLET